MKIGNYEVFSIETGRFGLDGGAMFGVVPKTLWSKKIPSDPYNRINLASRTLLIFYKDRKILVDVGCGHKFSEKQQEIYNVDYSKYSLKNSLSKFDLETTDITDVILTHFHFDHAGGATQYKDKHLEPTFPLASYFTQNSQWERALNPSEKDRGSYHREDIEPFQNSSQLNVLDGASELFPGLDLLISDGHTTGLEMVRIQDGSTTLFFCGDLMPTASHLPLPYLMGFDVYPLTTVEEKRAYLKQACQEDWLIALQHDPNYEAIRIRQGEKHYEISESINL